MEIVGAACGSCRLASAALKAVHEVLMPFMRSRIRGPIALEDVVPIEPTSYDLFATRSEPGKDRLRRLCFWMKNGTSSCRVPVDEVAHLRHLVG